MKKRKASPTSRAARAKRRGQSEPLVLPACLGERLTRLRARGGGAHVARSSKRPQKDEDRDEPDRGQAGLDDAPLANESARRRDFAAAQRADLVVERRHDETRRADSR